MDNADSPIRYRAAREVLKDEQAAEKIESELFENKEVQKWLELLKPETPLQHWNMEHGSFDFNLENAMIKCVHLGLHGDMPQMRDAVELYVDRMKNHYDMANWTANFLCLANVKDEFTLNYMLKALDGMYSVAERKKYDIYLSPEERSKLTGIPKNWKNTEYFIKPGFFGGEDRFPFIMDIIGLSGLYDLNDSDVAMKIDTVINYISSDEFHSKICDGYGILVAGEYASGNPKYNGMGWDPKYPGWFDVVRFMENEYPPKLLFFAEHIVKYPPALKTKWFNDLIDYLEKYKTENDTYIFPKEWLPEKSGYAVGGFHMSYGENRRKKNWLEIESTFYTQLLKQYIKGAVK